MGLAEDAQRRQVRLRVRALGHGVDEHADNLVARPRASAAVSVAGSASGPLGSPGGRLCGRHPQDVTGPQVPVGASHRNTVPALLGAAAGELGLRGVEVAVGQTSAHPLDEPGLTAGQ